MHEDVIMESYDSKLSDSPCYRCIRWIECSICFEPFDGKFDCLETKK